MLRRLVPNSRLISGSSSPLANAIRQYTTGGDQPPSSNKPRNSIFPGDFLNLQSFNSNKQNRNSNQSSIELGDNPQYEFQSHILNIQATASNTILSFCKDNGDVLVSASCGTAGFKKARRAGFESAYQAAVQLVEKVKRRNIDVSDLHIKFKGFSLGREATFRAIRSNTDWKISRITDVTPVPHNGCRPPKPRRL